MRRQARISKKYFEYIINEFEGTDFEIDIVGKGSKKNELNDLSIKNNVKVIKYR